MTSYSTGQKIELNDGRIARIRFIGTTAFQTGEWIGVELDDSTGKNDGSVKGTRYFTCEQGYGMFVRATGIRSVVEDAPKPQPKLNGASARPRPSSVHSGVNGVKKMDASHSRTSSVNATPTPAARSRLSGIRSPVKSPTKQLGSGLTSGATSRTATPPTTAAAAATRRPGVANAAVKPRQSIAATTRTSSATARPARTSLTPATTQRTSSTPTRPAVNQRQSTFRQPPRKIVEEEQEQESASQDESGRPASPDHSTSEADSVQDAVDNHTPRSFAPPAPPLPPPIPPDPQPRPSTRRGSSPAASIHSQRTIRSTAVSSRHIEELEAKIRLLERKRLEDRDVRRSLEQAQQERDKYQGIIEKLQKKYQPQQQEILDLKKELSESEKKRSVIEDLQAEHDSIMEMATLDKEMAEETAEALKAELESLRSRQEEMELELEVLREENEEFSKDMSPEERTSAGWLQLEKENDRLRSALLRLRDLTQDREAELKEDLAAVQSQVKDFESISSQLDETKQKLLASESNADDLRQQLDAALGAEEMIEELTERNMGLTEHIDELKGTIEDLENLVELNDELEINHVEAEKQLQDEIDFKDALVLDRDRVARQQQSALDDADYTINRFRELVTQLQSDLQDMQASKQITETEAADLESKSRAMIDLNLRLQSSASKTQVKAIDLELRKMEAAEASEHLSIVQLFLPDAFAGERDSVLALLRFRRIEFKATLLQTFVRERMTTFSTRTREENVFAAADALNCLTWIAGMADRFVKAIRMCSMEQFAKYSTARYELDPVERALSGYIDSLRREEINESEMADQLQRSIAVLSHLASIHLEDDLASHSDKLISQMTFLQSQLENVASSFVGIKQLINAEQHRQDEDHEEEEDSDVAFITARADALAVQARSIKVILGKSFRAIQELQERHLTLDPESTDIFESAEALTRRISKYTRSVGEALRDVFTQEGREEDLTANEIAAIITQVATTSFDLPAAEAGPFTAVLGQLRSLADTVADLASVPNDLDNTVEFERAPAPWVARSQQLQQYKMSAQDTEAKLARTRENLREREITIKSKETELEEQSVRIEMLEARMREASKRSARIAELERAVHQAKDNERKAKQELEKSQRDAEHELSRVRKEVDRAAKEGFRGATSHVQHHTVGPGAQVAMERQGHQITTLRATVRFLQDENTRLRLPPATAPRAVSRSIAWLYEPLVKPKTVRQQQEAMLQKSGRELLQGLQQLALAPNCIDLTTLPDNKLAWRPYKQSSRWQLQKCKVELAEWRSWRNDLVEEIYAFKHKK